MVEDDKRGYYFHQKNGLSRKRPSSCQHTVNHEVEFEDDSLIIRECIPEEETIDKIEHDSDIP
jgi:hypothetical protein